MSKSNNENAEQNGLLYNKVTLAEKLKDLRKRKGLTLAKLSTEIETKTGVSISATQLGKYENSETPDIIGLNNLLALANYYDKSMYYLLGMNECESVDNEAILRRLGFLDNTIKFFENIKDEDIEATYIVNTIFKSKKISKDVKNLIKAYREYVKAISNNHLEIDISSLSKIDLQLEDDVEKINDYLKHKEYTYLFKISEIAKRIAKHLKKRYNEEEDDDEDEVEVENSRTTGRKKK